MNRLEALKSILENFDDASDILKGLIRKAITEEEAQQPIVAAEHVTDTAVIADALGVETYATVGPELASPVDSVDSPQPREDQAGAVPAASAQL